MKIGNVCSICALRVPGQEGDKGHIRRTRERRFPSAPMAGAGFPVLPWKLPRDRADPHPGTEGDVG